ncbi:hypothetical protein PVL29_003398 [Vitis rotundifolia]|uniref:Uncharacterized protein n=1 Tax=Vitis rotundifolia TaxID=103349 RepID=A0AA39E326_VITRO|nr:hypothetical protein PVL29_003398 [Vitis rotundifolia]
MNPPRSFLPAMPMQLPALVQAPQSQWFVTVPPQQFHSISQTKNMGLPAPSPQFQFSQSQLYIGNHEPAFGGTGAPLSSSYTFAPASYGQMGINSSSATPSQALPQVPQVPQVQAPKVHSPQVHGPQVHVLQVHAPEAHAPCFPAGVQPRLLSESQSKSSVLPVQETGGQPSVTRVAGASIQDNLPVKAPSDWVEHTSAGRRYMI